MMLKTHIAFATLLGLFLYPLFNMNKLLFFVVLLFCSVLPDIDTVASKIGRGVRPLSDIINILFSHRGFFHSIFLPLIILVLFSYSGYFYIGLVAFFGYVSHLVMDGLTKTGVMFFTPLHDFKIRGFFKVGGFFEYVLFFVILGACVLKISLF